MSTLVQQLLFNIGMSLVKKWLSPEKSSEFIYVTLKAWADSDGDMNDWDSKVAELLKP
jgi:hypothetical protein